MALVQVATAGLAPAAVVAMEAVAAVMVVVAATVAAAAATVVVAAALPVPQAAAMVVVVVVDLVAQEGLGAQAGQVVRRAAVAVRPVVTPHVEESENAIAAARMMAVVVDAGVETKTTVATIGRRHCVVDASV